MSERGAVALVCDLDGVVWQGSSVIWPVVGQLEEYARTGNQVIFCTNNSFADPNSISDRLASIVTFSFDLISTVTVAATQVSWVGKRVCVVGSLVLAGAIESAGATIVGVDEAQCDAVVVGLDRSFTYEKLDGLCRYISDGAAFFGANWDRSFPTGVSRRSPGCGPLLAAVVHCTGVEPVILGKPSRMMADAVIRTSAPREIIGVVGDSPEQDGELAALLGVPFVHFDAGESEASLELSQLAERHFAEASAN